MGKTYEKLDEKLIAFIEKQKMFFVATAPLSDQGHVNLSPKGYDSFRILDDHTVAYLDLGGSGIETLAHLKENGRITIMFCAFEGKANILRLYGHGTAVSFDEPGFEEAMAQFPDYDKARSIITIKLTSLHDSCGWSVPFYRYERDRDQLKRYMDNFTLEDWKAHRLRTNATSIDGLEGLTPPTNTKTT
ncbi:MAG TPA: pyridoxamine 5'-phosphate oxidase family protein [Hellea balneolensis]|uniref:Pyridoxamine 5'-phosphate oxidase family protein n=1 Tax=Hellea balneolensis TaxID=287478 RepID=A0A7C3G5E5_9PROT|nr:pyridoxamine 5'-phosphate oxidase family protein [Hellea balneolensis]